MSSVVEVVIHYSVDAGELESVQAKILDSARRFGQNMASVTGGMSAQSASHIRNFAEESTKQFSKVTQSAKQFADQSTAHIKSYSELAQQYSSKTTAQLVADIQKNIIAINDERRQRIEAAQVGNTAEAKVHQERLQRIQVEQNALRSLAAQRDEVIRKGAGSSVGILGIGRELAGTVPGLGRATDLLAGLQAYTTATDALGKSSAATALKLGAIGLGAGAAYEGLKKTIDVGREFDSQMTQTYAVFGKLTDDQKKKMVQTAKETAEATNFSAAEVAKGYYWLASSGMTAEQAIASIPDVARFAKAGMFDLATATNLAAGAENALGLASTNAQENQQNLIRVTDVLTAANNNANGTIQLYSEALTNEAGAALKMVGKSIEEGTAALMAFANENVTGAEAGTALSIVLRDLETVGYKNEKQWKALGISVYDSGGKMKNIADIIGELEKATEGLSDKQKAETLHNLGFQQRSIQFTQELLGSSKDIRDFQTLLEKSTGATATTAATQMQSVDEKAKKLSVTIDNDLLTAFTALEPEIITAFDDLTKLAQGFGEVEQFVGHAIGKLNELSGVIGTLNPALGGVLDTLKSIPGFLAGMPGGQPLALLLHYVQESNAEDAKNAALGKPIQQLTEYDAAAGKGNDLMYGKQISVPDMLYDGGTGGKGNGKGALAAARDAAANAMAEEMANYMKLDKTAEEISQHRLELQLSTDTKIYEAALAHHQKAGQLHEKVMTDRLSLQKMHDEAAKKLAAQSTKEQQDDFKNIEAVEKDSLNKRLASLEIDSAKGVLTERQYNRQSLEDKVATSKAILDDSKFLGVNVEQNEKAYNDAVHALRLFNLKDAKSQAQQILDIENQLLKQKIDMMEDGLNKSLLQEQVRYEEERQKALKQDIDDTQKRNELLDAIDQQHQEKVEKLKQDAYQESWQATQDTVTGIVQAGADNMLAGLKGGFFDPVQQQLNQTQSGFTRFVSGIVGDLDKAAQQMVSKTLQFGALKLLAPGSKDAQGSLWDFLGIGGGDKGGSSPTTPAGAGAGANTDLLKQGLDKLLGGIPQFDDSPGPIGSAQGKSIMQGDHRLVWANQNDVLIDSTKLLGGNNAGFLPTGAVIEGANGGRFIEQQGQLPDSYRKGKYSGFKKRENEAHSLSQDTIDKDTQDLYYKEKGGLQESLHNFFGSINGTLNSSATSIANFVKDKVGSPLVGFGVGSTNVLGSGAMALTDSIFGTHSHEAYKHAIGKVRTSAGFNGTGFGVGEFAGEVAQATSMDNILSAAGITGALPGAGIGAYGSAGSTRDKAAKGDYLGATFSAGSAIGLGATFGKYGDGYGEKWMEKIQAKLTNTFEKETAEYLTKHAQGLIEHTAEKTIESVNPVETASAATGHQETTKQTTSKMKELAETTAAAKNALAGLTGTTNKIVKGGAQKGLSTGSKLLGIASLFTHIVDPTGTTAGILGDIGGLFGATAGLATGGILHLAEGDIVRGPGTTTSDSILARLSNREGVINARGVSNMGEDLIHGMNSGRITRDHFLPRPVQLEPVSTTASVQQHISVAVEPLISEVRALSNAILNRPINIDRNALTDGVTQGQGKRDQVAWS